MTITDAPSDLDLRWLPLDQLEPHPDNVRQDLGDLDDLVASVRSKGVLEPILALPAEEDRDTPGEFFHLVVAGHRRLEAALRAGLDQVPCVIRAMDPADVIETMLVENLQRAEISPVEEARAYLRLIELDTTMEDIARKVGRSLPLVRSRVRLTELPTEVLDLVHTGQISLEVAGLLIDHAADTGLMEQVLKWRQGDKAPWPLNQARNQIENWIHDRQRTQARDSAIAEVTAAGLELYGNPHWFPPHQLRLNGHVKVEQLALPVPARHAEERCHRVHLDERQRWDPETKTRTLEIDQIPVCIDPLAHTTDPPAEKRSKLQMHPDHYGHLLAAATEAAAADAARDAERAENQARAEARKQAAAARAGFVRQLLFHSDHQPQYPLLVARMIAVDIEAAFGTMGDHADVLLAGLDDDEGTLAEAYTEQLEAWLTSTDAADLSRLVEVWMLFTSEQVAPNPYSPGQAPWIEYVDHLAELGYDESDIERADIASIREKAQATQLAAQAKAEALAQREAENADPTAQIARDRFDEIYETDTVVFLFDLIAHDADTTGQTQYPMGEEGAIEELAELGLVELVPDGLDENIEIWASTDLARRLHEALGTIDRPAYLNRRAIADEAAGRDDVDEDGE